MSWLLNLAYLCLLIAVSPILAWRMLVHGKYRTGWGEKLLGRVPVRHGDRKCLWFHAVSVGEVLLLEPILSGLRQQLPHVDFVISTTTPTGRSVAEAKFPKDRVCYFPFDFSWAVCEAVRRLRPTAIVLVELELWPNFILHANRSGIPLALINGRVSERSARGYLQIRPLMSRLLDCFEVLAIQNATYADRLLALGASGQRVHVTGSVKFDRVTCDRRNPKTVELRRFFGIRNEERVFIAGSTQDPEESLALDTFAALRSRFPDLRLMIVPRHKERFDEVAKLIQSRGFPLLRRSSASTEQKDGRPVLLLDTLGELAACWGLAEIAFVGGSLTNRGGQNMIEPAGYGADLLFGPNTQNFRDVVELLLGQNAARVVQSGAELTAAIADSLTNAEESRQRGRLAQQLVLVQQGATAKTIEILAGISSLRTMRQKQQAA